jgi:hypothetical protein
MRIRFLLAGAAVLACLSTGSQAEIYQSRDAEGNVVFSDTPTAGSEKLDVQQTNTADSVDVPPPAPREERTNTPPSPVADDREEDGPIIIGGDNVGEDLYEAHRREERRDHLDGPGGARPQPTPLPAKPRPAPGRR